MALVCVPLSTVDALTLNMDSNVASLGAAGSVRLLLPETASVRVAVTTSLVSTSLTVRLPRVLRPLLVSVRSSASGPPLMTGASLLPLMVTVIVSVSLSGVPSLSVAVTVYVSTRLSPSAR